MTIIWTSWGLAGPSSDQVGLGSTLFSVCCMKLVKKNNPKLTLINLNHGLPYTFWHGDPKGWNKGPMGVGVGGIST